METGIGDTRIGDAERESVAAQLAEHVGAGRLNLAEYEGRVDRVYAARTAPELAAVLADLPRPAPAARPEPVARPSVDRAKLAAMWGPWLLASTICLVIWVATSLGTGHPLPFWPVWVFGPWGAVLLLGTLTGRGPRWGPASGGCHSRGPAPRA